MGYLLIVIGFYNWVLKLIRAIVSSSSTFHNCTQTLWVAVTAKPHFSAISFSSCFGSVYMQICANKLNTADLLQSDAGMF